MTLAESALGIGGGAILGGGTAPTNTFTIDLVHAELLNSNQRLNPFVKAHKTKHIREMLAFISEAHGFVPMQKAHCVVWVSFPDKRRRDVANLYPSIKASLDGLVDSGLLPDDSNEFLIGPDMRVDTPNKNGIYQFTFKFYEVA